MNLHERLKAIVEASTNPNRRYKELEEFSGITAATWKTYWTRGTRPSSEMIEAIGSRFPQYCEWLLTGRVSAHFQKDPTKHQEPAKEGEIDLSMLDEPMELTAEQLAEDMALANAIEAMRNARQVLTKRKARK